MGWILSKFRKSKSSMEILTKLESEITNISQFKASTVVWQKKVVGHLVTYSIVIYLLLAIFAYFMLFPAVRDTKDRLLLILPFLVFPFLIWGLRKLLTWWYHRKIIRDEKKLELLKQRKVKILDEVMEKETYKVAKGILDKFGDKTHVGGRPGPLPGLSAVFKPGPGGAGENQLRRRPVQDQSQLNKTMPVRNSSAPGGPAPTPASSKLNSTLSLTGARPTPGPGPAPGGPTPGPAPPAGRTPGPGGRSVPGPPLPRPVLPRERGYLDKFVEFLVGDGPANRYALICRQCESHNGMALREEFEYIAFRCCYCYYWNPARKQRPVAPRLTPAAERPAQTASDSSGSDISAASSRSGSRRGSQSEVVPSREEVQEQAESKAETSEEETKAVDAEPEAPSQEDQTEETAKENNDEMNQREINEELVVAPSSKEDEIKLENITGEDPAEDKTEIEAASKVEENEMEVDA